jgi:excisionase family DNA binding protein
MPKITKEDAARILSATPRTVERLASKGKLSVTYEKGATRDVPMYDEDEVKRLAEQPRAAAQPAVVTTAQEPSQAIATRGDNGDNVLSQAVAFLLNQEHKRLTDPAPTVSDISHKLMLTLKEASQLAGLSRDHLRGAIESKKLKGRIIGRGFKVKREDLEQYVRKL